MVLVSIIIGLGIGHILLGIGGIIDRRSGHGPPLELSVAHAAWLGTVFVWMVLFWWWEYRFAELLSEWTVQLYFFLVTYAVSLFLMAAVLVPRTWDGVTDLSTYLIERRAWFYSLYFFVNVVDLFDSYLKGGWPYLADLGPFNWAYSAATIPICWVGIRSRDPVHHGAIAVVCLIWQISIGPVNLPSLGL